MDQSRLLGLMALGEGFGAIGNLAGGRPQQPSQVMPLLLKQREQEEKDKRAMAGLAALGIGGPSPAAPTSGLGALGVGSPAPSGIGSMPQAPQLPPQIAQAARAIAASQGPEAAVRFITDYQLKAATTSPAAGPTSVQEFEAAKAEGYQGRYVDFLRDKATWSRAPGTSVKIVNEGPIPPGYQMVRDANNNPLRLQPIPGSPAYNEALSGAESSVATADEIIRDIDAVIADPNLERATGWGSYLPVDIPGFNAETRSRLNKLEGQAFLGAIDRLKGTGQITEIEGQKATQAIARLNAAQSADEFRTALREFRSVVDAGRRRAVRNLQTTTGRAAPNVPPLTPAEMADEELMRALGLE
jgi:hypothetical protein